jgi:glutathione S-transferase
LAAYRLHYFPESGNSYKIALMLTLCGQTFEPIWTDFGGGVTRTAEWRSAVNEMGEIPVLEENGQRYIQTAPLLLRLAERYARFGGSDESEQFEILHWLFWDNHKLTGYMATYRFQRAFTPSPNPDALKFLKDRLDQFLDVLEGHLSQQPFVVGERPTVVDLSANAYLQYPIDESGCDFAASHPAIKTWLLRVAALPGWRAPYALLPGKRLTNYADAVAAGTMTTGSADAAVPEGFAPLFRTSPFLDMLGPFFYRTVEGGFVIGLRVEEKHGNARGAAHGSFLLTLADIALGDQA